MNSEISDNNQEPLIRVLYAEDSSSDADLTISHFQSEAPEFAFDIAGTGKDFLKRLEEGGFDVLLLDFRLPDMDGLDLLRELASFGVKSPIVMVTGSGDEDKVVRAFRFGITDYVTKDTHYLETLPTILRNALRDHRVGHRTEWWPAVRRYRILYIERSPFDLDLTQRYFAEAAPHLVLECTDSSDNALGRLSGDHGFDLVLMDLRMPDIPALEFMHRMKLLGIHLPVVIITGRGDEETAVTTLKLGAYDYIVKRDNYLTHLPYAIENAIARFQLKNINQELYKELIELNKSLDEKVTLRTAELQQEIIERKRAEKKLIEARSDWESTFNAVTDMITVQDQEFNIIRANPSAHTMLGLPLEAENHEAKCFSCFHGMEAPLPECPSRRSLQTGLPSTIERFEPYLGKYLEIRAMPRFGSDGELVGLIHIVRDVTERRLAEAERERLMAAIEQAGEAILITDPEGAIQYVNPAFELVSGYSREEVLGKNPRILKSGKQDKAFYDELWITISSGRTWEGRIVNKCKDGSFYTEDATISPVRDAGGRIVNYVAVKRDVTEQLRLADQFQQAQKMESVGRLAGGVAHDFNNMLGVILGYAEMVMYEAAPGTILYENLMEIRRAAHRSADLTRQLLAFARKQTIDPRVLDLNETVEGMLKMLRRLIGEDIDLAWLPGARLWPVKMDPVQLDQVLANLCVNARDAIAGVGKVTIETENVLLDEAYCALHAGFTTGEHVTLSVSDSGCGMNKETLDRVFEPFFTTKEMGKGTGLGLSTVYGIVKQNKGFINAYSEPGHGTTLKIYLPRHSGGIVGTGTARPAEIQRGYGETVLIVEDEPAILNVGKGMLEKLGYTVLGATTPHDAMHLAQEYAGEIHLLMTDVVMPEMNGRELAEQLLVAKPEMKCLFMSGYTSNAIAHHGVLEKGVHFIQKPFSMKDLGARVREVLGEVMHDE